MPTSRDSTSRGALIPALGVLVGVGVMVLAARFYEAWPLRLPTCTFRTLTGLPCVACGGTRAFVSLAQGEWLAAVRFNPLATVAALGSVGWAIFAMVTRRALNLPPKLTVTVFVALVLANWAWLILTLPE